MYDEVNSYIKSSKLKKLYKWSWVDILQKEKDNK